MTKLIPVDASTITWLTLADEPGVRVHKDAFVSGTVRLYGSAVVAGTARVVENTTVGGQAQITGQAHLRGRSQALGRAWVYGSAQLSGSAKVQESASVHGEAHVGERSVVYGESVVGGKAYIGGTTRLCGNAHISGAGDLQKTDDYMILHVQGPRPITLHRDLKIRVRVCYGAFSGSLEEFASRLGDRPDDELAKQLVVLASDRLVERMTSL